MSNLGWTEFDILNANQLYVNGQPFTAYISNLIAEDNLEQGEIDEIKAFLARLDLQITAPNTLTITNDNRNSVLKARLDTAATDIDNLENKLANIDTTALTQSSALTNDNRNSVLKSRLDTAATDITSLTTRVTTAEADIDNLETRETASETNITAIKAKTDYMEIFTGSYANANSTHGIIIGGNIWSQNDTTNAKKKLATLSVGYPTQGFAVHYDPDAAENTKERARVVMSNPFGGHAIVMSSYTRIQGSSAVNIGEVGLNLGYETINIGGKMSHINIGSIEDPEVATYVGDPAANNSTKISIGKRATLKNTWTYLNGNIYTSEARWEDLPRTDKYSWTQLGALIPTAGIPAWVVSFALTSSIPNFEYSDTLVLKDGPPQLNKTGEMTTTNEPKLQGLVIFNRDLNVARLTPVEGTFVARGTISKTTLDGSIRQSCFLDGGGDNKIAFKHHNIAVSDITDWATTEGNDKCNVVEIGGDSGILIHQGAANSGTDIKIINSKAGNIVLKVGTGGGLRNSAKDSFTVINDANYPGAAIGRLSPQAFATDETARTNNPIGRLEIECVANRKGIRLFGYDPTQPFTMLTDETNLTHQLINTPAVTATTATTGSIVISGNYTGDTANRIYKNSNNKLFWNGIELTPAPTPTLSQVLDSGATANQLINMNTNKITGITALEGSSNGNWNVKEITAGTNISVSPTNGNYTIANNAPTQDVASGFGIQVAKNGTTATVINNAAVQNLTEGTGITILVDTPTRNATISNSAPVQNIQAGTGIVVSVDPGTKMATITSTLTAGGQAARDQLSATNSVGLVPNKLSHYAQNWVTTAVTTIPMDIFVSHDGRNCVYIPGTGNNYVQYSLDYGATWTNSNLTSFNFATICGSSTGEICYLTRFETTTITSGSVTNVVYTSRIHVSYNYGVSWSELSLDRTQGAANTWYNRFINKIRCSADGTVIIANTIYTTSSSGVANNGVLYISTNSGSAWTAKSITGSAAQVSDCCMSANGSIMFAAMNGVLGGSTDNGNGGIYRSFDYGATWTKVKNQIAAGSYFFGIIKCDATGRFLVACDDSQSANPAGGQIQTSDDYGSSWTWFGDEQARGATGAFVSPGGNLMLTLHNTGYDSRVRYSTDYGRNWTTAFAMVGINASTFRTLASNHDGSVLLLSNNGVAAIYRSIEERGRLELSAISRDLSLLPSYGGGYTLFSNPTTTLWFSGGFEVQTGNPQHKVEFDFLSAGKIDLLQYNIRYEIDCYWSTGTWSYIYPLLSINDVLNTDVQGTNPNISHQELSGLTNWTNNINNGTYGGAEVYVQTYNNRFFAGYFPGSTNNANAGANSIQRQRSIIKGTLSVHRRPTGQTGITDASQNARDILNIFTCDNYATRFYSGMSYLMNSNAQQGIDYGINHQRINGTAIMAAESVWGYNAIANSPIGSGVQRLGLHLSEGGTTTLHRPRAAHYTYRIYRERK